MRSLGKVRGKRSDFPSTLSLHFNFYSLPSFFHSSLPLARDADRFSEVTRKTSQALTSQTLCEPVHEFYDFCGRVSQIISDPFRCVWCLQ